MFKVYQTQQNKNGTRYWLTDGFLDAWIDLDKQGQFIDGTFKVDSKPHKLCIEAIEKNAS